MWSEWSFGGSYPLIAIFHSISNLSIYIACLPYMSSDIDTHYTCHPSPFLIIGSCPRPEKEALPVTNSALNLHWDRAFYDKFKIYTYKANPMISASDSAFCFEVHSPCRKKWQILYPVKYLKIFVCHSEYQLMCRPLRSIANWRHCRDGHIYLNNFSYNLP